MPRSRDRRTTGPRPQSAPSGPAGTATAASTDALGGTVGAMVLRPGRPDETQPVVAIPACATDSRSSSSASESGSSSRGLAESAAQRSAATAARSAGVHRLTSVPFEGAGEATPFVKSASAKGPREVRGQRHSTGQRRSRLREGVRRQGKRTRRRGLRVRRASSADGGHGNDSRV